MTESGKSKTNTGSRWLRCLGRLTFTAPMAAACLLLALGDPAPLTVTFVVVGLWLWLAASVVAGIVRAAKAVEAAASQPSGNINPIYFMRRIPRVCIWTSLLLLAVATGALFAIGERALASTMEIFLIIRLAMSLAPDSEFIPKRKDAFEQDYISVASAPGAFGTAVIASTVWLALGSPPGWAENMLLTWFWIIAVGMIAVNCLLVYSWTFSRRWMEKHYNESLRRSGAPPSTRGWPPAPPVTPEPHRTPSQQFNMWLWRAGWIVVAWALWAAGQPLLASLYLLGSMLKLAVRVRVRRRKHGDTARIDFLARAVAFIIWWPFVAVGAVGTAVVLVPLGILGAIWDRIVAALPAGKPEPQTSWEREARLEWARIRRSSASYRLREAFGMPGGFVYFLYSEPHQREHYLGAGGLLHGLEDRVVARDWRKTVTPAQKVTRWNLFRRTPEGALLHVNGIGNMRKDLPLIAVVPPRGLVQVFRLSEAYRARIRDKGTAVDRAEMEVRVAIDVTLGAAAGEAKPC